MHNIICIAGPTASGKTALAVALAKEIDASLSSHEYWHSQAYR